MNSDSLKNHLICFIHIPKTAGSSFTDILIKLIGYDNFRILLPDVINGIKEADFDINRYKGISGHFPYEISKLISRPALFLTFLREPLSRSLSHFKQIQRTNLNYPWIKQSDNYKFFEQTRNMSYIDFAKHPFFSQEVSNLQTRMLGLFINHPIQHIKEVVPIDLSETGDRWVSLALAKERLEQFAFIGLQEKFQESLGFFSYQFSTYPIVNLPNINVSSDSSGLSTLPQEIIEQMSELNKMDIELYEFGQKIFVKRYNEMLTTLRSEHQMRGSETLYEMLSAEFCKVHEIKEFPYRYEFEEIYPRSGWHAVERIEDMQWIWSGPETVSTVELPIERSNNLRMRFEIKYYIDPDIFKSLEVRIDDRRIHLIHTVENNIHLFSGIIPADEKKQVSTTTISFHVNRTAYPPGMTAETPGARLLGIALNWIEFSPLGE